MTPVELDLLKADIQAGNLDSLDDPFLPFPNSADIMARLATASPCEGDDNDDK